MGESTTGGRVNLPQGISHLYPLATFVLFKDNVKTSPDISNDNFNISPTHFSFLFPFPFFVKVFLLEKHAFLFVFHYIQNYIACYGDRKPITTFYNHSHQLSEIFLRIRILILTTGLFSCSCNALTK